MVRSWRPARSVFRVEGGASSMPRQCIPFSGSLGSTFFSLSQTFCDLFDANLFSNRFQDVPRRCSSIAGSRPRSRDRRRVEATEDRAEGPPLNTSPAAVLAWISRPRIRTWFDRRSREIRVTRRRPTIRIARPRGRSLAMRTKLVADVRATRTNRDGCNASAGDLFSTHASRSDVSLANAELLASKRHPTRHGPTQLATARPDSPRRDWLARRKLDPRQHSPR